MVLVKPSAPRSEVRRVLSALFTSAARFRIDGVERKVRAALALLEHV
jgi:hypothetical protein